MAFSYLRPENLSELATAARDAMQPYFDARKEAKRIAENKPKDNIPKGLPRVTDGTISAFVSSTPRAIIQQIPTGEVDSLDEDKDAAGISEIILSEEILPNANSTGTPIQKSWNAMRLALTYGSQPAYVFFKHDGNYLGADFKLVDIRDVWLEPGKPYDKDCNYKFLRSWYQPSDIEKIKNQAKKDRLAGESSPWNLEVLEMLEEKTKDNDDDISSSKGFGIIFGFQKGVGMKIYGFDLDSGEIVYEKINPDPTGAIPIVSLYADIDMVDPLGRSPILPVIGHQNMLDAEMQMYQFAQAMGLAPPIIKQGSYSSSTLRMEPNAIWDLGAGNNNSASILNVNTTALNNFSNNYSLIKTQIMNHVNLQDSSVSAAVGNIGYSKTHAGVEQQQQRLNINNNQLLKNFESWFGDICEIMLNLHFALNHGETTIKLTEQYIKRKKLQDPDFDADTAKVEFDKIERGFKFNVSASTSKVKDDKDSIDKLENLLRLSVEYPVLQSVY
ncbi:MAG: hypothetical protein Q4A30_02555, partial [Candidatus Saccharibacteria bacterium]|nr:hypothetical protein [Candidatus Saccharibacteria bacterium]